jgi:hypothetical protein
METPFLRGLLRKTNLISIFSISEADVSSSKTNN